MECVTAALVRHEGERSIELTRGTVQSLYDALRRVPDQRRLRGRRYAAATVVVLLL